MRRPYTYLIGWAKADRWYYGVRFRDGCDPSELWRTYFTSSDVVSKTRAELGEPDVIQIRRVFTSIADAKRWEDTVLRRIPKQHRGKWLNIVFNSFRGITITDAGRKKIGASSRRRGCPKRIRLKISRSMKGVKRSAEAKQKVSTASRANIERVGGYREWPGWIAMQSEDVKKKRANSNRGRLQSEETKRKISQSLKKFFDNRKVCGGVAPH